VLLHHVMGETEGRRHSWSFVEGGMGGVSSAIAASAQSHGTEIFTGMVSNAFCVIAGPSTKRMSILRSLLRYFLPMVSMPVL